MTTREEWLARRREILPDGMCAIGASDVPEILFGEPLKAYAQKLGHETEDSYLLSRGKRMEEAVALEYAEQVGRPVRNLGEFEIQQHPQIPWLRATLDRITWFDKYDHADKESGAPLQLKVAIGSARDWKEGPPLEHVAQVQAEIACWGSSWGSLAGLIGPGPLAVHDILRDDAFIEAALPHLMLFRRQVRDRTPPMAKSSLAIEPAKRLWGVESGEEITLPPEALDTVVTWEQARIGAAGAEEWLLACKAKLMVLMTDASVGHLSDGSSLCWVKAGKGRRLERKWFRR